MPFLESEKSSWGLLANELMLLALTVPNGTEAQKTIKGVFSTNIYFAHCRLSDSVCGTGRTGKESETNTT